jgi:S-DNA-T family DNA segregation ATPase FtsK/SpoIIIE
LAHADGRFLIAGPARSGRSSALVSIADQTLLAGGRLLIAAPHRSPLTSWSARRGLACLAPDDTAWNDSKDNLSTAEPGQVNLLLIDDTEQFTDAPAGDLLSTWIAQQRAGSAVVASARSEDLMVSFRGLAVDIRRSRTGLLLQPTVPDGDLLGVRVTPHRSRMPPGRGLLITEEYRQCAPDGLPVQLALP